MDSFKEVARSVIPIMIIVFLLELFVIDLPFILLMRFVVGSIVVIIGLGIFLLGVEMSISQFGEHIGEFIVRRSSVIKVLLAGLLFAFAMTVAEPDVIILANQISNVAGGSISSQTIIIAVSLGVGLLVGLGLVRTVKDIPMKKFFAFFYLLYLSLLLIVPESFQALAFDASGASTGAITTPFFLAIAMGASKLKGSKSGEADSFGMVGTASMGPILAILLISFFIDIEVGGFTSAEFVVEGGIFEPLINGILPTMLESFLALLPIVVIFFVLNFFSFKLSKREIRRIIVGLIYTFIGLVGFLLGVTSGFMDMGTALGMELASLSSASMTLPLIGFILGAVIVLAEPSVYVLGNQIQDVTAGSIKKTSIFVALSVGVGLAVAISMVRVMVPSLRFWMIIGPCFFITVLLNFIVKPIFVGIAFDSGGVGSGPMSATFLVAMLQGASSVIPTADPILDGFGVLATIAMMPILCVTILGVVYTIQENKRGVA